MLNSNRIMALIPARAGSKGIANKNLAMLAGHPLIYYSITSAKASRYIDRVVVSSDGDKILACASSLGAEALKRPADISTDTTAMAPVIQHFIDASSLDDEDRIVLLQPTSPLRRAEHIDAAIAMSRRNDSTVISVVDVGDHHPYKAFRVDDKGRLRGLIDDDAPFSRRQDCPPCYYANGAIYVFRVLDFLRQGRIPLLHASPYPMSDQDSLDIDNNEDLEAAEARLKSDAFV